jgi:membrane protease YdiL (CAAX protease family)
MRDRVEQLQQKLKMAELNPNSTDRNDVMEKITKPLQAAQHNFQKINLELGLIQAVQNQPTAAQQLWQQIEHDLPASSLATTAEVLAQLWTPEKSIPAPAAQIITNNLTGWFRYQSLKQLYQRQAAAAELQQLQTQQMSVAVAAIYKLATVTVVRGGGLLLGIGWGLWLIIAQLWQRQQPPAPSRGGLVLVQPTSSALSTILFTEKTGQLAVPWDGEIIWQVILGFLVIGQLLLPIVFNIGFAVTKFNPAQAELWQKAAYIFFSYLAMAIGVIWFMQRSLAPYQPLTADWFSFRGRKNWVLWGLGGYLIATPLVSIVSVINDKIWQGKGGSNPILSIVLDSKDNVAFMLFLLTAAVAAPLFEEYLFRGFLLPSLTRYLSIGQSIVVSGIVFEDAHLSLSELIPLAVLGMILGYVYYRTGNLLASMLMHSLWNGGTMLTLYLLAS